MKKLYIKPEACAVTFAVNENIAASFSYTTSEDGLVTYIQALGTSCNQVLNSTNISTGLVPGCTKIEHVMENLQKRLDEDIAAQKDPASSDIMALMAALEAIKQAAESNNEVPVFICAQ